VPAGCFPDPNQTRNRILAVSVNKSAHRGGRTIAQDLLALESLQAFTVLVLFDAHIDLHDGSLLLWKVFNNVDPERDVVRQGPRVVIDACKKGPMDGHDREWPDELTLDA
jgi:4-hydroxy-3-polyprenylbenzoate decarboxylase